MTKGNQSVEKTLRIIEAMVDAGQPMRLLDIAQRVDYPSCTVLRMLNTLMDMGYAYQEENDLKRYGLTLKFAALGQRVADQTTYQSIVHPFLQQLSARTGETCCASVLEQHKARYFDVVVGGANGALTVRQKIGSSAFLHCTGSGKMFLVQYTPEQLDELEQLRGLPAFTPHTITTRERLTEELRLCRERGYAIDDEEVEIGMRCIAAPVFDNRGKTIVTICMSGPSVRMTKERIETELAGLLLDTARRITEKIAGSRITL